MQQQVKLLDRAACVIHFYGGDLEGLVFVEDGVVVDVLGFEVVKPEFLADFFALNVVEQLDHGR